MMLRRYVCCTGDLNIQVFSAAGVSIDIRLQVFYRISSRREGSAGKGWEERRGRIGCLCAQNAPLGPSFVVHPAVQSIAVRSFV